jgi:REP element-mobilizing transposase RayT
MLKFVKGGVYHIYNEGCGQQAVFFQKRNYRYFMRKIRTYIHPYAEVLACKLMLNKIHLIVQVKHLELFIPERNRMRSFAASIGIMLRSYAQAINKQEKRRGVLWQGPTKADHYPELEDDVLSDDNPSQLTAINEKPDIALSSSKKISSYQIGLGVLRGLWLKVGVIIKIILLALLAICFECWPSQKEDQKLVPVYKLNSFLNLLA